MRRMPSNNDFRILDLNSVGDIVTQSFILAQIYSVADSASTDAIADARKIRRNTTSLQKIFYPCPQSVSPIEFKTKL